MSAGRSQAAGGAAAGARTATVPVAAQTAVAHTGTVAASAAAEAREARRPGYRRQKTARGLAARHPLALLAVCGALVLAAILVENPLLLAALIAIDLLTLGAAGRLPAASPYLKAGLYTALVVLIINPLFSQGGVTSLLTAHLGPFTLRLTWEGLAAGLGQSLHLLAIILAFGLLNALLDPDDQLALLSRLSFRSALVVSLATRLLPVLSHDAARIGDAQRSRGAELDRGRWHRRAAARGPLLSGLLSQSLERAADVAASMEARGFGRSPRTRWAGKKRFSSRDCLLAGAGLGASALALACAVTGLLSFHYFPTIANPLSAASLWPVVLMAALAAPGIAGLVWRRS